jgi:hypothetical protein
MKAGGLGVEYRLPNHVLALNLGTSTSPRRRNRIPQLRRIRTPTPHTMLSRSLRAIRAPSILRRSVSTATTSNQVLANDPVKRSAPPNVSATNAVPTSSEGSFDKALQESVQDAEKLRKVQAPNYKGVWSRSQTPREVAMSGPRFEQSIVEDQVCFGCGLRKVHWLIAGIASSLRRHRAHPQTTRALDTFAQRVVRRRRRAPWSSQDFHQS